MALLPPGLMRELEAGRGRGDGLATTGWGDEDEEEQVEDDDPSVGSPFSEPSSDGSSESSSDDAATDSDGETPPQSPSPRGRMGAQQWAQGSPLRQALAFRDGSFARFSRPDSADADAAKATLIEASEAATWGPLDDDPWLSSQLREQSKRSPRRKARAKSARAGGRNPRPTSASMIEQALVNAAAQAAAVRQIELDGPSGNVGSRREWGPSLPRRHADDPPDSRSKRTKDSVRVMRWSNMPPEHGSEAAAANGRGIVTAVSATDRKPQKDWIKELYERRQRIAKRGQGHAKARVDTRITTDTQARLTGILGKDDAALSTAEVNPGQSGRGNLSLPLTDPSPQLRWRPPRAASAPPRPLAGVGVQERQAAAAVHISTSSLPGAVPVAAGSGTGGFRAPYTAAVAPTPVQTQLSTGKLANLTNRQLQGSSSVPQWPTAQHGREKVPALLWPPSSTSSASAASACVASGKAPALVKRSVGSAIMSGGGGGTGGSRPPSSTSLASRTVQVRRGRPASAAVVTPHGHSKQQWPQQQLVRDKDANMPREGGGAGGGGGATLQRRPVSAGPFYPSSKGSRDGMSESAVAQSVAAEAARRNAALLTMRPTSSSRRSSNRAKPVKRPLVVRAA